MTIKKSVENLLDEIFDIEAEILDIVDILIEAEWDSNIVKQKIHVNMKQRYRLMEEIDIAYSRCKEHSP